MEAVGGLYEFGYGGAGVGVGKTGGLCMRYALLLLVGLLEVLPYRILNNPIPCT